MTERPSWYQGPATLIERAAAVADAAVPVFFDPAAIIGKYESNNNYSIGVGGVDLSSAPVNAVGFPQWAGTGNSHAAGRYQFEPATWAIYAAPLGITDFSPQSQDAVFAACFSARGFADWLNFDAPLAAAVKAAGGEAAFSLGATWLAKSGVTVPTPMPISPPAPPPPLPTLPSETYIGTLQSSTGKSIAVSVTEVAAPAVGGTMAIGAIAGIVMMIMNPAGPPQAAAQAPIPEAKSFSGSWSGDRYPVTLRFEDGQARWARISQ